MRSGVKLKESSNDKGNLISFTWGKLKLAQVTEG